VIGTALLAAQIRHRGYAQRTPVFYLNRRRAYKAIAMNAAVSAAKPDIRKTAEKLKPSSDHSPTMTRSAETSEVVGDELERVDWYTVMVVIVASSV
jgi:hypothetical protein